MWALLISGIIAISAQPAEVNQKAVRHFQHTFKDASDVHWSKADDCYRASFISDHIKYVADYHPNGRWRNTIRTSNEGLLPRDLGRTIRSVFTDSEILHVSELRIGNALVYFVKIRREGWTKTVQIVDHDMAVVEEFREL